MWYRGSGWDGPSAIGVADSSDGGLTWIKYKGNPVWKQPENGCGGQPWVYKEGPQKYWLFTTNNDPPQGARTCLGFSKDGLAWANASKTSRSVIPVPPDGKLFGNRAVWKEDDGSWKMLQECMTTNGVWQIFLYEGTDPLTWAVGNGGKPLVQLQRHANSMYGGCHIATVSKCGAGVF
jgi:sucrose-6-phosphate hydrolase SacC (GH32 family)